MRFLIQMATFAVTGVIQREQHVGSKFPTFFQHLVDDLGIDVGVFRQLFQFCFDLQQFVQHKLHVTQGGDILTHGFLLTKK